ncbi:methionine--tRNA ligase-like isoform X2 [Hylaeus volcanicus]|uniref:methionine--tRNA ligase-like isoform X2 n=1 Tax=Hylaeus volcanicus TaxID=313075 RepID=UPI0023B8772C|nr:methionine--tRNA ligase-like isoform X2 [Hylaeus volcanicus]
MIFRYNSKYNPEAFIGFIISKYYNLPLTFVKVTCLKNVELLVEEPQVTRTITSLYAITRYLCQLHQLNGDERSKGSLASLREEETIIWVLCDLIPVLHGLNIQKMRHVMEFLEKKLATFSQSTCVLVSHLFIYAVLKSNFVYETIKQNIKVSPVLDAFLLFIEKQENFKAIRTTTSKFDLMFQSTLNLKKQANKPFYISTAINYTNSSPHVGHAYESVLADTIARYYKNELGQVLFTTGTDEHGQKIATNAAEQGKTPLEICDYYTKQFQELNQQLNVKYTRFVRTTSDQHCHVAQTVWKLCEERGDIYLGTYTGWYNVREEKYIPEVEAKLLNYKDPVTNKPFLKMQEESYFFKMSKYQQHLIDYIHEHENFILPVYRRNEVLARLTTCPLEDLSCSRTGMTWGIPIPNDSRHVMYVWFDALTSYLTGCQFDGKNISSHWPPNVQLIGKDILWFHCVIWPCLLFSLQLPLPECILAHGFVLDKTGCKMSKSLQNVVDPFAVLSQTRSSDLFRFYLVYCGEVGKDLKFDADNLKIIRDSELADTFGNLVHRATGLCVKYCHGQIPECSMISDFPPFNFRVALFEFFQSMDNFMLHEALTLTLQLCRTVNKYLTEKAPWTLKDDMEKRRICRVLLESVYYLAHFLSPFLPCTCDKIFQRLGTCQRKLRDLSPFYQNLNSGTTITVDHVLFEKN